MSGKTKPGFLCFEDYFPKDFFKTYYEKKYLYQPGAIPKPHLVDLISLETIDGLISANAINPDLIRVVSGGKREMEFIPKTKKGRLNYLEIKKRLKDGDTLIINSLHEPSAEMKRMINSLGRYLGQRVLGNAYFTPPGKTGFPAHIDVHDVLVIQLWGKKTWKIYNEYENRIERPTHHLENVINGRDFIPIEKNVDVLELSAGDLLYLPLGTMHAPFCADMGSFHISIGIYPISWTEYIQTACDLLALSDPDFRENSPLTIKGRKQDFRKVAKTLKKLADKIIALDPSRVEQNRFMDSASVAGVIVENTVSEPLRGTTETKLNGRDYTLVFSERCDMRIFQDQEGDWHLWTLGHEVDIREETARVLLQLQKEGRLKSSKLRKTVGDKATLNISEICRTIGIAGIEFD